MDKKQGFMIVWTNGDIAGISGTLRQVRKSALNLQGSFHIEDSKGRKVFRKDDKELTQAAYRVKVGPCSQKAVRNNELAKPARRTRNNSYAAKKRRENEKAGPCVTLAEVWPK
jgi:hypothetical protein